MRRGRFKFYLNLPFHATSGSETGDGVRRKTISALENDNPYEN